MAGLSWLDGKCWWEVSRDERYFCAELYHVIREDSDRLIVYLNDVHEMQLSAASAWEVVYEACFYRDLWHARGRQDAPLSPKRTFDLALFSNDEILLIEAKAHQEFDLPQLQSFSKDAAEVTRLTNVARVRLAALASSRYALHQSVRAYFDGPVLTWLELATLYDQNPKLMRADALYESARAARNASERMTGAELIAAFNRNERFYVGRRGGLRGPALRQDVEAGSWRTQQYETNRDLDRVPNRNWFTLEEFARAVGDPR